MTPLVQTRAFALGVLLTTTSLVGCALPPDASAPGPAPRDEGVDELYRDFVDGKMDGAGHPVGAAVYEAESGCEGQTGLVVEDGVELARSLDDAGAVCRGTTSELGRGPYALNVRAALVAPCDASEAGDACGSVFTLRARDASGAALAEREVAATDFTTPGAYENVALSFRVATPGPVSFEVDYTGGPSVRVDYVELFRKGRQLIVSPPSGVLDEGAELRIELVDPPSDHALEVTCGDIDVSERLSAMLADGDAREELTDFRRIVTAPADSLLEACGRPARVVVRLHRNGVKATSEARYLAEAPPCAFEGDAAAPRVLLTGFTPFPAGATQHNSSMEAVLAFDPATTPGAQVMKVILPVEFENSAAWIEDVVTRCAPDVVVGFGQGRGRVDLETTAYNRRDTSNVAGGVPDNRGLVVEPAAIRDDGPDEYRTELPVDAILADLGAAGVDIALSDDPGRYVCNDIFYSMSSLPGADTRTTGFVHMPYAREVAGERREELAGVVGAVVRHTVAALRP